MCDLPKKTNVREDGDYFDLLETSNKLSKERQGRSFFCFGIR